MMNLQLIQELVGWVEQGSVSSLRYDEGHDRLTLRRSMADRPTRAADVGPESAPAQVSEDDAWTPIQAPASGIFYGAHPLDSGVEEATGQRGPDRQMIGYLKVGVLLTAVLAPAEVGALRQLIPDGQLVGFGTELMEFLPPR